ncbi:hypothetical protein ACTXT7_014575, partial [Hymenolepis weldensis]
MTWTGGDDARISNPSIGDSDLHTTDKSPAQFLHQSFQTVAFARKSKKKSHQSDPANYSCDVVSDVSRIWVDRPDAQAVVVKHQEMCNCSPQFYDLPSALKQMLVYD